MTIKECYEKMGGDYEGVLKRLGSEALIQRFAIKFLKDSSFGDLKEGIESGDAEKAFRGAHTLKGVCLNLGFESLYQASAELTEKLRGRELKDYEEFYKAVEEQYHRVINAIREYES